MDRLQRFLFKRQREILRDLSLLAPDANDLDPASFFQRFDELGEAGFKDAGKCQGTLIVLPGPVEACDGAHLHVEERYQPGDPITLSFYRYEICWGYEFAIEPDGDDYLRESFVGLRRGVRFDHHPKVQDQHHPQYHWHPNGCSEFRLSTHQMSPLKAALLARVMFGPPVADLIANTPQLANAMDGLRRDIPNLP